MKNSANIYTDMVNSVAPTVFGHSEVYRCMYAENACEKWRWLRPVFDFSVSLYFLFSCVAVGVAGRVLRRLKYGESRVQPARPFVAGRRYTCGGHPTGTVIIIGRLETS